MPFESLGLQASKDKKINTGIKRCMTDGYAVYMAEFDKTICILLC